MPKVKRKPAPDGNELSEVQWAPISTVARAPMMPQPPPLPPMAPGAPPPNPYGAFHSVSSEGPSTPGAVAGGRGDNMLRASDLRVQPPVLPSNGPTDHHHHYIPTPTSSGRATPTNIHPGAGNPLQAQISNNYSTANPSHGRPFPGHDQPGPHSSHILPSIERPESSNGRHTPVAGSQPPPPPPEPNPFRFSKYSQPPPPPMLPPMHQSPLTHHHHHHHHHSPPRPENPHPPTPSAPPPQQRSLNDDEVRRLQRFMSLNWRVGVINHPPFARRNNHHGPAPNPEHGRRAAEDGPQIAGFVGSPGSLGQAGRQRPR